MNGIRNGIEKVNRHTRMTTADHRPQPLTIDITEILPTLMSVHLAPSSYLIFNTYLFLFSFYIFCYRMFMLAINVFH